MWSIKENTVVFCTKQKKWYGQLGHRDLEQMEPILNFQVPAEGLQLVVLLHTQY